MKRPHVNNYSGSFDDPGISKRDEYVYKKFSDSKNSEVSESSSQHSSEKKKTKKWQINSALNNFVHKNKADLHNDDLQKYNDQSTKQIFNKNSESKKNNQDSTSNMQDSRKNWFQKKIDVNKLLKNKKYLNIYKSSKAESVSTDNITEKANSKKNSANFRAPFESEDNKEQLYVAPKIEKDKFIKSVKKINNPNAKVKNFENLTENENFIRHHRVRKTYNNASSPEKIQSERSFLGLRKTSIKVTQKGSSHRMLLLVSVLLIIAVCLVFMAPTIKAWVVQSREMQKIQTQIEQTKKHNQHLKKKLKELSNPSIIADQARQRLGYVKKGETTYIVVDPQTVTKVRPKSSFIEKAPRKPWFNLLYDSIKSIEEQKNKKNISKIKKSSKHSKLKDDKTDVNESGMNKSESKKPTSGKSAKNNLPEKSKR